jgi:hypothetical protein
MHVQLRTVERRKEREERENSYIELMLGDCWIIHTARSVSELPLPHTLPQTGVGKRGEDGMTQDHKIIILCSNFIRTSITPDHQTFLQADSSEAISALLSRGSSFVVQDASHLMLCLQGFRSECHTKTHLIRYVGFPFDSEGQRLASCQVPP